MIFFKSAQGLDPAVFAEIPDMEGLDLQDPEAVIIMLFSTFDAIHEKHSFLTHSEKENALLLLGIRALPDGSALC
jgi:hypothetical protein